MAIPLLTPEAVKIGSSRQELEQGARLRVMNSEESRLIANINHLRQIEREEKQRIEDQSAKNEGVMIAKKTVLTREVEALESRKEQALRPVREIENEARKVLEENKAYGLVLDKRAAYLKERDAEITEKLEQIADSRQELDERGLKIDSREKGVEAAAEEVRRSTDVLSEKWVEYHMVVAQFKDREQVVYDREKAAEASEKANVIRAAELDRRSADQDEKDREIADKYATLERSIERSNKTQ